MSRHWEKSGLKPGDDLIIPTSLFVEPSKAPARLVSTKYLSENEAGILIECTFLPSFGLPDAKYKMFLNWASIFCGQIKVKLPNGDILRAYREEGQPIGPVKVK